jgi:hypothetical protein
VRLRAADLLIDRGRGGEVALDRLGHHGPDLTPVRAGPARVDHGPGRRRHAVQAGVALGRIQRERALHDHEARRAAAHRVRDEYLYPIGRWSVHEAVPVQHAQPRQLAAPTGIQGRGDPALLLGEAARSHQVDPGQDALPVAGPDAPVDGHVVDAALEDLVAGGQIVLAVQDVTEAWQQACPKHPTSVASGTREYRPAPKSVDNEGALWITGPVRKGPFLCRKR